jgi:hypothetical protein
LHFFIYLDSGQVFQAGAALGIAAAASLVLRFGVLLQAKLLFAPVLFEEGAKMVELHLPKLVFEAAFAMRVVAAPLIVIFTQILDVGRVDVQGAASAALLLAARAALAAAAALLAAASCAAAAGFLLILGAALRLAALPLGACCALLAALAADGLRPP